MIKFDKKKAEEAIASAKSGSQEAFAYLYEAYYKHTYMAARDIIASHEECEDIVQEAFMRAFAKLQENVDISGFGSYMEQTAKNIAIDHIKAREAKKRPDEVLSSFQSNDAEDDENLDLVDADRTEIQNALLKMSEFNKTPEEKYEEKELQDIIQSILSELPDYQQESLSLFYLEGMKYREIADLYGVSVDTIKSRVNQGKKKVEKKVIELEKTKGIKLRGIAPIAFFFVLLRHSSEAKAAELSVSGETFVATKVTASCTKRGSMGSIKAFFEKSVSIAGRTVSTKVITAVVIGAVGVGTITGINVYKNSNTDNEASHYVKEKVQKKNVKSDAKDEKKTDDEKAHTTEQEKEVETKKIEAISDTSNLVEIGGKYQADDGSQLSISMYTDGTPGGTVNIMDQRNLYIVDEGSNNIYTLSVSYKGMQDAGIKLVSMSDNSINLFENGEFVKNYKLIERFYS